MLEKHRDELEVYSVSYNEKRLASGETLTGTPVVTVLSGNHATGFTDITSQFGTLSPTLADTNTDVQFTLNAATGSNQQPGVYVVHVECGTSNSRTLVETTYLTVSDRGSV